MKPTTTEFLGDETGATIVLNRLTRLGYRLRAGLFYRDGMYVAFADCYWPDFPGYGMRACELTFRNFLEHRKQIAKAIRLLRKDIASRCVL